MKTFLNYIVTLFIGLYFIFGCEFNNGPQNKKYTHSLLFNLVVNETRQEFYIYKIVKDEDVNDFEGKSPDIYFEKGANIILYNSDLNYNSFVLKKLSNTYTTARNLFYSNSESLKLNTNTKYNIDISINGNIITGSTTTPSDFNIITPTPNSTFRLNDLRNGAGINIKWEKSSSAKGYIGKIFIHKGNNDISKESPFITLDTTFNWNESSSTGKAVINIYAFDKNYYKHFIDLSQSAGIKGAYGYFGSSIKKSVTVNIE